MSGRFVSLATLLMGAEPLSRFYLFFIFNGFFLLNGRNLFPSRAGVRVTRGMGLE